MNDSLKKFQDLLRELFQFDRADLDFGIYRIMNHKRDVIEKFIVEDIPEVVSDALKEGMLSEQAYLAEEINVVLEKIRDNLGPDAVDGDGNLADTYRDTAVGKRYLRLVARNRGARNTAVVETSIFNHLFAFFSRYYQEGDFISKQRYSRKQRYAIPYNGEEVHLHWANHDQYYIKTTEHFDHYTFQVRNVTVHFRVQTAELEQDNIKGDKKFFLPATKDIAWDRKEKELTIPFEFRPLDEHEKNGERTQRQDKINDQTLEEIPDRIPTQEARTSLLEEHHRNTDGEPVSILEHHLRQYTRRNTSDFFIHKNLKSFLSQELDFYLKNEMLNLEDMEHAGEDLAEGWFQEVRAIKTVGNQIIDFLYQIESFQKMLWEKRKFITETQHCVTMGNIDPAFYPDIATCESQWDEWKELLHIDEEEANLFNSGKGAKGKRVLFLEQHPTLVLDTKHFTPDFIDQLLESFDDLDEISDGLLIKSENFQSLTFLAEKYNRKIGNIYIDPPYNTNASAILYKNDYKNSSWLSLMQNRLLVARTLLSNDGILCVAIDDEEAWRLRGLLQNIFERELGIAPVRSTPAGRKSSGCFSPSHEYAFFYGKSDAAPGCLRKTEKELERYPFEDEQGRYSWANLIRSGSGALRRHRPKQFYPIYVRADDSIYIPKMKWNEQEGQYDLLEKQKDNETVVWPVTHENGTKIEKRWHRGWKRVMGEPNEYRVRRGKNGEISIDFKTRMDMRSMPKTWWGKNLYSSANHGTKALREILPNNEFDYPKAVTLVEDCLLASGSDRKKAYVCDYFAGSGTTGHAVINLNRLDGGQRKFVLTEMGNHFDSVILPRLKKIIFAPEWKDGMPNREPTQEESMRSPRLIKYIRLESYEDALNNIDFDETTTQRALELDGYLLRYMLQWETKHSNTLLNTEKLTNPFDYKLHAGNRLQEVAADIPETFNYLLGLHVCTRKLLSDGKRRYLVYRGKTRDDLDTVIIWRNTDGWQKNDLERDKKFVAKHKITAGANQVFVNGDSLIREATSLDPLFKARMFAEVKA